jgi:hypothetical protein
MLASRSELATTKLANELYFLCLTGKDSAEARSGGVTPITDQSEAAHGDCTAGVSRHREE